MIKQSSYTSLNLYLTEYNVGEQNNSTPQYNNLAIVGSTYL